MISKVYILPNFYITNMILALICLNIILASNIAKKKIPSFFLIPNLIIYLLFSSLTIYYKRGYITIEI